MYMLFCVLMIVSVCLTFVYWDIQFFIDFLRKRDMSKEQYREYIVKKYGGNTRARKTVQHSVRQEKKRINEYGLDDDWRISK